MAGAYYYLLSITIFSLLLLQLPTGSWAQHQPENPNVEYHNGKMLTGQINLAVLWYGRFGRSHKDILRDFVKSINKSGPRINDPSVNTWWKTVQEYQALISGGNPKAPIHVQMVKQRTDKSCSVGKVLTQDTFPTLVEKATAKATENSIAVIFTARDVSIQGTCTDKCSLHGVVGTGPSSKLYIVVVNPESECPSQCAWPFYRAAKGPQTLPLLPPNGQIGADAMVIEFASALAQTVTNPYNDGFYSGNEFRMAEIVQACPGVFGSGAFPGFAGKIRMQPGTGGCFNSHGVNRRRFLLPAVWNITSSSCQTLM